MPAFSETYHTRSPNQIETAIAKQFGDPALWSSEQRARMRAGPLAGLQRRPGDDTAYSVGDKPSQHWVALLYGSRVTNSEAPSWDWATFETVDLETMTEIQAHLANTVLASEHARPSVLVDPPVARWQAMGRDRTNNIFWLEQLISGVWPIMAMSEADDGQRKSYFSHDFSDYHNALCLLLPRETQDLITEVAHHELAWVLRHEAGEVPRQLSLPEDTPVNPFGMSLVEQDSYHHYNGMYIIDHLAETAGYIYLLHYLMQGKEATPEARMAAVEAYITSGRGDYNDPIYSATIGARQMYKGTGAMVNFISRHRTGSNTTQEAVDAAYESFKQGTVRVAEKILGEYNPAQEFTTTQSLIYR